MFRVCFTQTGHGDGEQEILLAFEAGQIAQIACLRLTATICLAQFSQ